MTDHSNVIDLPQSSERDFFRIDGTVYLFYERETSESMIAESGVLPVAPSFERALDDYCGLSIDALREHIALSKFERPLQEVLTEMAEVFKLLKLHVDSVLVGEKPRHFRREKINISGSGLSFVSHDEFERGAILNITVFFPRYPYTAIRVRSQIVKTAKIEEGFLYKTHFIDLSEKTQDEILRFVNQLQRDLMHK